MDWRLSAPLLVEELGKGVLAAPNGELRPNANMSSAICQSSSFRVHDPGDSFVSSLRSCTKNKDLYRGTKIHEDILKMGLLERCTDALVTMYAKCGELEKAQELLDMHKSRDVITWTSLIAAYARKGQSRKALNCFDCMQHEGITPNVVTYTCILNACASIGDVGKGKKIHDVVTRQGLIQHNIALGNALVDMYAKCGALSIAQEVLEELPCRDIVSWNSMIGGYAQEGHGEQALNCFEHMRHEGVSPNAVTYIGILKACAITKAIDKGEEFHEEIAKKGLLEKNMALGTALLDMYAKCGALSKAQNLLENLPQRNVVSWNTLITGCVQEGQGEQALYCFDLMHRDGITPDAVTYLSILKACGFIRSMDKGQDIHEKLVKAGLLEDNVMLSNALLDMYAKCGALSRAQGVLEKLPYRNVVSWSTLIAGYAKEGLGEQALDLFECMLSEGIRPDGVTFVCLLNVCSHLGLVDKGHELFTDMSRKYGLIPNPECYTCMIDLFGRAGHLEKAVELVQDMPSKERCAIWLALLDACRTRGDVDLGRWAFEQAVQVDQSHGPSYFLMEQIYASAGMLKNARYIKAMRMPKTAQLDRAGRCCS